MSNKLQAFFFYLLTLIICGPTPHSDYKPSRKEQLSNEVTNHTAQAIYKEKGLRVCGTGGGAILSIRKLNLAFDYFQEVDIDTARELIVYSVERFLEIINAKKEIRPYLKQYPFMPENIEITIFFHSKKGYDVSPNQLAVVGILEGKIHYRTERDLSPENVSLKDTHKETYDEAFKIVHGISREESGIDRPED